MDEVLIRRRLEVALQETEPDFGAFFLLRFFGFEVTYGDGTCTVDIPIGDYMGNPQGSLHGGVLVTAIDISMGHLCNRELSTAVTLDIDVKFLRPVHGPARCEARFLKRGRQLIQLESRVHNEQGKLSAVATGTWFRLPQRDDGDGGDDG
jgi:acyl-CoA thioesterase